MLQSICQPICSTQVSQRGADTDCRLSQDAQPDGSHLSTDWEGDGATAYGLHSTSVLCCFLSAAFFEAPGIYTHTQHMQTGKHHIRFISGMLLRSRSLTKRTSQKQMTQRQMKIYMKIKMRQKLIIQTVSMCISEYGRMFFLVALDNFEVS